MDVNNRILPPGSTSGARGLRGRWPRPLLGRQRSYQRWTPASAPTSVAVARACLA